MLFSGSAESALERLSASAEDRKRHLSIMLRNWKRALRFPTLVSAISPDPSLTQLFW